jgi:tetratricopeptide (TPR) repeat protein
VEGNPLSAPFYLRVLGFVELSRGNAAEASAHLRSALSHMAEVRILEPGVLRIHADAVEALVGAGDLDQAEAVLGPWEEQARRIDLAWSLATSARCRGFLEAARGHPDEALTSFDRALLEHERLAMPFELGRTLLARGQVERRAKRNAAAKRSLEAALALFEELGAPLWIAKAQGEIARLGLRRAPGELTEDTYRAFSSLTSFGFFAVDPQRLEHPLEEEAGLLVDGPDVGLAAVEEAEDRLVDRDEDRPEKLDVGAISLETRLRLADAAQRVDELLDAYAGPVALDEVALPVPACGHAARLRTSPRGGIGRFPTFGPLGSLRPRDAHRAPPAYGCRASGRHGRDSPPPSSG